MVRLMYYDIHKIDIIRTVSAPSLSLLILRQNHLDIEIPVLSKPMDNLIRPSYFGGSSDYFKLFGQLLKYVDVNSLYPTVMLLDMPLKFIETVTNIKLVDCFGFIEAKITAPNNLEHPLLLTKLDDNSTVHPLGSWKGIYFSEELKNAEKFGYKITIIKAHQFTKGKIFLPYVNFMYQFKKNAANSAERYIAKLHLNSIYGIFGRRKETISTIICRTEEERDYIAKYPVIGFIEIDENYTLLLLEYNVNYKAAKVLNIDLSKLDGLNNVNSIVNSNVAIASAVTGYARIEMSKYKNNPNIELFYTDTDSIFYKGELDPSIFNNELGGVKDELKGDIITEAYFFGIKQYAYKTSSGKIVSVFAGIPRNSLTWDNVLELVKGGSVGVKVKSQFRRKFKNLYVTIEDNIIKYIKINLERGKRLVDNKYIPPVIKRNKHILRN